MCATDEGGEAGGRRTMLIGDLLPGRDGGCRSGVSDVARLEQDEWCRPAAGPILGVPNGVWHCLDRNGGVQIIT